MALALVACSQDSAPDPSVQRDVLLVTIDTLRSDVVSAYGHPRPTTPNLDGIGNAGAIFERAYTTTPMTARMPIATITSASVNPRRGAESFWLGRFAWVTG